MNDWPAAIARVLLAAWAGATWATVAWVAPALFRVVAPAAGRPLAGEMAGHLFRGLAWGGLAAGLAIGVLWYRAGRLDRLTLWVLFAAAAAPLVSENLIRPLMEAARAAGTTGGAFAAWHAVSGVLYVVSCAALLWLVAVRER